MNSSLSDLFKKAYGDTLMGMLYPKHSIKGPYFIKSDGEALYAVHGTELSKEDWDAHPEVIEYKRQQLIKELLSE